MKKISKKQWLILSILLIVLSIIIFALVKNFLKDNLEKETITTNEIVNTANDTNVIENENIENTTNLESNTTIENSEETPTENVVETVSTTEKTTTTIVSKVEEPSNPVVEKPKTQTSTKNPVSEPIQPPTTNNNNSNNNSNAKPVEEPKPVQEAPTQPSTPVDTVKRISDTEYTNEVNKYLSDIKSIKPGLKYVNSKRGYVFWPYRTSEISIFTENISFGTIYYYVEKFVEGNQEKFKYYIDWAGN